MNKDIVASIEARMTSSRLPGKVLMEAVNNVTMLEFMIERVQKASLIDGVIVATTINDSDDPIAALCHRLSVPCYRGSEEDVLLRVLEAHNSVGSSIIVELTGDCPLIDPAIIDKVVQVYIDNAYDFVSNGHVRSYPDGLDVGIFSVDLLEEVEKKTNDPYDRENVSSYIYRSGQYSLESVIADKDLFWPELRITLDDTGDYELIINIIHYFYAQKMVDFTAYDIVHYLRTHPELLRLNEDARVNISPYQTNADSPTND
jgi:spore coat polysaccharide biosynthesis protein SpsF